MAAEILIIKLSSLGDLLHALPAVHALKSGLNASRLDWVTQPEYVKMVQCFTDVDDIITYPRKGFAKNYTSFRRTLRARKYDYVFDLQGLLKSAVVAASADADKKIGPYGPREGARFFYHSFPTHGAPYRHAIDRLWEVVPHLNIEFDQKKFPLRFPEVAIAGDAPRIALVPCSRWGAKNWPVERFAELAERLSGERKAAVYIVGGPADRPVGEQISAADYNFCGEHSLPKTGDVLRQMDVVVTNDSGPMHIAAALGTPTVALFGPTDPRLTGPYGEGHVILRSAEAEEQGPGHHGYKSDDNHLMHNISVEEVFQAVCGILGG